MFFLPCFWSLLWAFFLWVRPSFFFSTAGIFAREPCRAPGPKAGERPPDKRRRRQDCGLWRRAHLRRGLFPALEFGSRVTVEVWVGVRVGVSVGVGVGVRIGVGVSVGVEVSVGVRIGVEVGVSVGVGVGVGVRVRFGLGLGLGPRLILSLRLFRFMDIGGRDGVEKGGGRRGVGLGEGPRGGCRGRALVVFRFCSLFPPRLDSRRFFFPSLSVLLVPLPTSARTSASQRARVISGRDELDGVQTAT